MSDRNFVGMLLTEDDLNRNEDERKEYAIVKELGEEYKDKTFQEVAEYLTKNKDDLDAQQRTTADQVISDLRQHSESPCHFLAYKDNGVGQITTVKDPDGKKDLKPDYAVRPYIDSRTLPSGEEYDCIDMVISKAGGIQEDTEYHK